MTSLNVFAAVFNTGEFSYGKLCIGCTFVLANGETLDDDNRDLRTVETKCETYEFTLGHLHTGGDGRWTDNNICYHRGTECEEDCECEYTQFDSTNHCDMCGDSLAGYRHDCIMIKRDLVNTKMTQEQFDKLTYLCKGYKVDMKIADYLVYPEQSFMMPGWAEGWVGGEAGSTIYVGVSPQGDSHS